MKKVLVVLLVAVLGLLSGAGCSGDNAATTTAAPTTVAPTTVAPTTTATLPTSTTGATTSGAGTTTTAGGGVTTGGGVSISPSADSAGWQKVFEFSGGDDGDDEWTSELFALSGAPARLTYAVETDTVWTMAAFVLPEGHDLKAQGGFPDVWESDAKTGTVELEKDAGSYFVHVAAANCAWKVVIEEKK